MDKLHKFLMMLLVATFSFAFTGCSDDDTDDDADVTTVVVDFGDWQPIGNNCRFRTFGEVIHVEGGFHRFVGNFESLKSVKTAPSYIGAHLQDLHDGGCYVVLCNAGGYIKFRVEVNKEDKNVLLQYQEFTPKSITD